MPPLSGFGIESKNHKNVQTPASDSVAAVSTEIDSPNAVRGWTLILDSEQNVQTPASDSVASVSKEIDSQTLCDSGNLT